MDQLGKENVHTDMQLENVIETKETQSRQKVTEQDLTEDYTDLLTLQNCSHMGWEGQG